MARIFFKSLWGVLANIRRGASGSAYSHKPKPDILQFSKRHIERLRGKEQQKIFIFLSGVFSSIEIFMWTMRAAGVAFSGWVSYLGGLGIGLAGLAISLAGLGGMSRWLISLVAFIAAYPHVPYRLLYPYILIPFGPGYVYGLLVLAMPTYHYRQLIQLRDITYKVDNSIHYSHSLSEKEYEQFVKDSFFMPSRY